jgi:uronate dehydrogenase
VAHIHYSIVYGVSANRTSFWSNITADDIGFAPVDDAFEALTSIERVQLSDDASDIERVFQGGWFCGMEFGSDPARID